MSYGTECWPIKVEDIRKMELTRMRMHRMVCGKTLKNRVKSELIIKMIDVELLKEFSRSQRLKRSKERQQ